MLFSPFPFDLFYEDYYEDDWFDDDDDLYLEDYDWVQFNLVECGTWDAEVYRFKSCYPD